jgi:glucokinase
MTDLPRQAIVGDIGHTNIRFAVADIDELTISNFGYLSTAMFSGPGEALRAYLRSIPERPPIVSIAVAGAVNGEAAGLSHLDWSFTADDIRSVIDARVHLTNGFEALALLLPHLDAHDVHRINGGEVRAGAPRVVLGPGTTMEAAALLPTAGRAIAVSGRAGAISFACHDQAELALLGEMRPAQPFVAVDDVLSSGGLVELERVLSKRSMGARSTAANIVKAALVHHEPAAQGALRQFAVWLGGFAGDMALLYGAAGGVYIAGGMMPAMLETLSDGAFRAAFEAKGAAGAFLAEVPIHVITAPDACLRGAALVAANASGDGTVKLVSAA